MSKVLNRVWESKVEIIKAREKYTSLSAKRVTVTFVLLLDINKLKTDSPQGKVGHI